MSDLRKTEHARREAIIGGLLHAITSERLRNDGKMQEALGAALNELEDAWASIDAARPAINAQIRTTAECARRGFVIAELSDLNARAASCLKDAIGAMRTMKYALASIARRAGSQTDLEYLAAMAPGSLAVFAETAVMKLKNERAAA